jgi:hypothetical protein
MQLLGSAGACEDPAFARAGAAALAALTGGAGDAEEREAALSDTWSSVEEAAAGAVAAGAPAALAAALRGHAGDADTVRHAATALRNIAAGDEAAGAAVAAAAGETLAEAVGRHAESDAEVCRVAVGALLNLPEGEQRAGLARVAGTLRAARSAHGEAHPATRAVLDEAMVRLFMSDEKC